MYVNREENKKRMDDVALAAFYNFSEQKTADTTNMQKEITDLKLTIQSKYEEINKLKSEIQVLNAEMFKNKGVICSLVKIIDENNTVKSIDIDKIKQKSKSLLRDIKNRNIEHENNNTIKAAYKKKISEMKANFDGYKQNSINEINKLKEERSELLTKIEHLELQIVRIKNVILNTRSTSKLQENTKRSLYHSTHDIGRKPMIQVNHTHKSHKYKAFPKDKMKRETVFDSMVQNKKTKVNL